MYVGHIYFLLSHLPRLLSLPRPPLVFDAGDGVVDSMDTIVGGDVNQDGVVDEMDGELCTMRPIAFL